MHPQADAENRILRSNHPTQLGSLVLAGVLSTILMVGVDCLLEVKTAQAGVMENGDRHSPSPSTDQSLDHASDQSLEYPLEQSLEQSGNQSLNAIDIGIQPFPDVSKLSSSTPLQSLKASTVKLELPINLTSVAAPVLAADFAVEALPASDTGSASNTVPEFSPAIALASGEITSTETEPASYLSDQAPAVRDLNSSDQPLADQLLADTRDADLTEGKQRSLLGTPLVHVQSAYILQDGQSSGRLRASGIYVVTPNLLFGTTIDLSAGNDFTNADGVNLDLNELYFTLSPASLPNLRFTAGMIDLTSYFDRNSFAKDSVTHFFNPVFQTNPALAATGIGSRPGALLNWDVTDVLNFKAAAFSSSRDLGDFAIDGFAGEVGLRLGNFVVRGTYASDRDAGQRDGFQEIFQFSRGNRQFGLRAGDREEAFGINAEAFIPELNLGLFGRYGHYENQELDRGGDTYSFGITLLDLFMTDDRLGLAYGRELSNDALRQDRGDKIPDVLEVFYDVRLSPNLRAGATFQQRDGFSDTVLGIRVRADFDIR